MKAKMDTQKRTIDPKALEAYRIKRYPFDLIIKSPGSRKACYAGHKVRLL
jgi:hypothetical protein